MSDWIKISERLPINNLTVLVRADFHLYGGRYIIASFDGQDWYSDIEPEYDHQSCPTLDSVTHWMPIPNESITDRI